MKTVILVCALLAGCACALAAEGNVLARAEPRAFFKDVPRAGANLQAEHEAESHNLRIVHGDIAAPGQFPYYVGVYVDLAGYCGGSLINKKWVLTAAHCIDGGGYWLMFMGVTGLVKPKDDGREVHVSRGGLHHPDYNRNRIINDLGLVQLLGEVTLSDNIGTVTLTPSTRTYESLIGTTPTVAGFGLTSDSAHTISPDLRYTAMTIVSRDICYDVYQDSHVSQICLSTALTNTSSCSGDSGGPLVLYDDTSKKPTQIGCTSFGATAGCEKGYPVGFTNLAIFIDWIEQTTGIRYPFDAVATA